MIPMIVPDSQPGNRNQVAEPVQSKHSIITTLFENQWQIIKNPKHFLILLIICAVIFLLLGIITLVLALQVKNIQVDYASMRKCKDTNIESDKCSVKINIPEDMEAPVYLLYSLKNVYINHRKFLNSFSPEQLKGKAIQPAEATKLCGKYVYNSNIPQKTSWGGSALNPDDIASLCGVKPQGFFNDTYSLYQNGQQIPINETKSYEGSTIESHRGPKSEQNQWIDPQNAHFKQYLLDGSLMTKKRVWGVLTNGLKAGNYQLLVKNNYQMANMKIIKGILLTTSTVMGGKIFFFPVMFGLLTLGCIGLIIYLVVLFSNYNKLKKHSKQYS